MLFSTDLPNGLNAVLRHISSGASILSNVRKEADASFMRELQRTDPCRHSGLLKNMQKAAVVTLRSAESRCSHCDLVLPSEKRRDSRYCDTACKMGAFRSRDAA